LKPQMTQIAQRNADAVELLARPSSRWSGPGRCRSPRVLLHLRHLRHLRFPILFVDKPW